MKRLPFLPGIDRAHIANEIAAMRSEKHGYRPMAPTRPSLIPSGCHKLTRSCTQNGLCVAEARSPMSLLQKAERVGDFFALNAQMEGVGGHFWHDESITTTS